MSGASPKREEAWLQFYLRLAPRLRWWPLRLRYRWSSAWASTPQQSTARKGGSQSAAKLEVAAARPPFAFATFFALVRTLFVDTRRVRRYNAIINEQRSF